MSFDYNNSVSFGDEDEEEFTSKTVREKIL